MEFLKELFSEPLTYDAFSAKVSEKGFKIADLSTGDYVSKRRHENELSEKNNEITELNEQLSNRDTDLEQLQNTLSSESTDNKTKLAELTQSLTDLQTNYDNVKKDYDVKLEKQAYEFAVKEFAGTQNFTSKAAKRDFIAEMLKSDLKLDDGNILGASDFVTKYSKENDDAFLNTEPEEGKPVFTAPSPAKPQTAPGGDNPFAGLFKFNGV